MSRLILLFFLLTASLGATQIVRGPILAGQPPPVYSFDFEETGTPSNISVTAGSPNFDYTITKWAGAQALLLSGTTPRCESAPLPAPGDVYWTDAYAYLTDISSSPYFLQIASGATHIASFRSLTDGKLRILRADSTTTGVTTGTAVIAINTWYRFVVKYTASTATVVLYTYDATTGTLLSTLTDSANDAGGILGSVTRFRAGASTIYDNARMGLHDLR